MHMASEYLEWSCPCEDAPHPRTDHARSSYLAPPPHIHGQDDLPPLPDGFIL